MHVLPRVRELEERFPSTLSVIGVHAGKYSSERVTSRIAQACERLGVRHAVVNDRQFRVWHDYAVRAWPTVALVDPEGYLVGVQPGEFDVEAMAEAIEAVVDRARSRGTLRPGPDPAAPPPPSSGAPGLRFPTRAVASEGVLWVADTGNGRVLQCDVSGDAGATVLSEHQGFGEPRGLAPTRGGVFVADRAGHRIWRIEHSERHAVAGTGALGDYRIHPGPAVESDLRSPWGLALSGDTLVVAMAGSHQVWGVDLSGDALTLIAGAGPEDISDGRARDAFLAQPTGVSMAGARLLTSECESSSVRVIDRDADEVRTLVGTGLFDFGDRPGVGDAALLQHNEDAAWHKGLVAVADTYNDRLKLLDPATRELVPWPGAAGEAGSLREPGGVWSDGSVLWVSDTGNHRVVKVDDEGSITEVTLA